MSQTVPPAPRFTAKGMATRSRIVESAAALMFENGVAGTSIEDVQKKASVSASQLYHYFGDKSSLVRSVIAFQTEAVLERQGPFLNSLDSIEAFEAWRDYQVERQVAKRSHNGCAIGSLANELADQSADARADLTESFSRWEQPIQAGLAGMKERGELRDDADPAQLAIAVMAAVQGGLLLSKTQRDAAPLRVALTVIIDHIRSLTTDHAPAAG